MEGLGGEDLDFLEIFRRWLVGRLTTSFIVFVRLDLATEIGGSTGATGAGPEAQVRKALA